MHRFNKAFLGVLVSCAVVGAGCSGSQEATNEVPEANAPIDQIDTPSGGVSTGPITGLVTVQPSFGFGAYVVDPTTGRASAVPGIAAVETIDRNNDVIVSGNAAFSLGSRTRDEQTFAADISVVKIDYETGQATQLVGLGFDRESDDSDSSTSYSLEAVAGEHVVVSERTFGGADTTFSVYDSSTGEQTASFGQPTYAFESDTGSCSGGISELIGLPDGRVAGVALGSPAILGLDNGDIELLIGCDEPDPELASVVGIEDIADYAVFNEGPAPTEDQLLGLLMSDLAPAWGFIEGDGDLWWVAADLRTIDDVRAIVGGIVQFDIESGTVEAVHPLGPHLGSYTDCVAAGDSCEVSTLEQAQLRWVDGRLIVLDVRENGRLLTLTPDTGVVSATDLGRGPGVDYTSADLLAGDPSRVWLEVRRMTITSDDENGRTASGPSFIERFDFDAGRIDLSLPGEDLFS